MSEAKVMRLIALGMFLAALVSGGIFAVTGFAVGWLFVTAALIVGAFMAAALSFAA